MDGIVALCLEIRIDARELAEWPAPCIKEFFAGLALSQGAIAQARASMRSRARVGAPEEGRRDGE